MPRKRVWRAETWFPWRDVRLVVEPGSAQLIVPGRLTMAMAALVSQIPIWWFLAFMWIILPTVRPQYDTLALDLFIGAGVGGSAALFAVILLLQPRLITFRPSRILALRFLKAGPEGFYSYADVDLGGVGTRIRVMASWMRFSRELHRSVGDPPHASAAH